MSVGPLSAASPTRSDAPRRLRRPRGGSRACRSRSAAIRRLRASMASPRGAAGVLGNDGGLFASAPAQQLSARRVGEHQRAVDPDRDRRRTGSWSRPARPCRHRRAGAAARAWSARPREAAAPARRSGGEMPQRRQHRQSAKLPAIARRSAIVICSLQSSILVRHAPDDVVRVVGDQQRSVRPRQDRHGPSPDARLVVGRRPADDEVLVARRSACRRGSEFARPCSRCAACGSTTRAAPETRRRDTRPETACPCRRPGQAAPSATAAARPARSPWPPGRAARPCGAGPRWARCRRTASRRSRRRGCATRSRAPGRRRACRARAPRPTARVVPGRNVSPTALRTPVANGPQHAAVGVHLENRRARRRLDVDVRRRTRRSRRASCRRG